MFRGLPKDPFEGQAPDTTKRDDLALSGKIRERLNLGRTMPANNRNFVGFQASTAAPFQIDAAARLVGPFNASPNYSKPQSVALAEGALTVALVANILTVRDANGRMATFDLNKLSAEMGPLSVKTAPETAAKRVPLRLARSTGELPAEMLLTGASGHQGESAIADVQNVSFWLLLGP